MGSDRNRRLISVFGNSFDKSDLRGVATVLRSHLVGAGEVTRQFEDRFKKRIGFKHASATSSCTNGFWLLLRSLGFKKGDEVIVPNVHFFGIKGVLDLLGIKCRIVDVGAPVPNITLEAMRDRVTDRTKAVIFLEYGGYPVRDAPRIRKYLAQKGRSDIALILDAANSPFTKRHGKYSARDYDYAVYSFDMNKLLVTGEGGMVLSDHGDVLGRVKALSHYGIGGTVSTGFARSRSSDIWWETETVAPGLKLGMNNIAASLGLSQLAKIDAILRKRERVARYYRKALRPLESAGVLRLPEEYGDAENCVYLFWLTLEDESTRNRLAKHLLAHHVYSTVKYQPLDKRSRTPGAFRFYGRALNIPFNQNLTRAHQRHIVAAIRGFFGHAA